MEHVCIQISAKLFAAVYQKFGDDTQSAINRALSELAGSEVALPPINSLRPKQGTITGRVWEIADRFRDEHGQARRNDVVQACIDAGINMNTANTQFTHWLKENK